MQERWCYVAHNIFLSKKHILFKNALHYDLTDHEACIEFITIASDKNGKFRRDALKGAVLGAEEVRNSALVKEFNDLLAPLEADFEKKRTTKTNLGRFKTWVSTKLDKLTKKLYRKGHPDFQK